MRGDTITPKATGEPLDEEDVYDQLGDGMVDVRVTFELSVPLQSVDGITEADLENDDRLIELAVYQLDNGIEDYIIDGPEFHDAGISR